MREVLILARKSEMFSVNLASARTFRRTRFFHVTDQKAIPNEQNNK